MAFCSPVQMLNVFLQRMKVTLGQWSIGNDKTNEPGCLKNHLAELLAADPGTENYFPLEWQTLKFQNALDLEVLAKSIGSLGKAGGPFGLARALTLFVLQGDE